MSKHHLNTILWVFIMLILSACTSRPLPISDDSICSPPCWNSLTPGVTNYDETLRFLTGLPSAKKDAIETRTFSKDHLYADLFNQIIFYEYSNNKSAEFYFIDGILAVMSFFGELDITFGEAVGYFSEPESIVISGTIGPSKFLFGDSFHFHVSAVLPDNGILFGYDNFYVPKRWSLGIHPEIELDVITFFEPRLFNQLAESGIFPGITSLRQVEENMHPWKGYAELGTVYPYAKP